MTADFRVVRHPRARTIRLSVDPATGAVRLTIPRRASERAAREWAAAQTHWIAEQREKLAAACPFVPGAEIPLSGDVVRIDWSERYDRRVRREGDVLRCGGPRDALAGRVERWLRAEALAILTPETHVIAERAGVTVTRVSVGDPRSRWGSCSSNGAIRYSWRLILAPPEVLRATVAHEVAHRVHMNHGPEFHALVQNLHRGDPHSARDWLRRNGAALHRFGRDD